MLKKTVCNINVAPQASFVTGANYAVNGSNYEHTNSSRSRHRTVGPPCDDKRTTQIAIEGETLQIVGPLQGDAKNNTYVWIPSLKAVVCGDIVYDGIFPWTLETTPAERKDWITVLDKIAGLNPSVVVAGHKKPELKDDPSSLQFTKNYLTYYDQALAASKSSEEFQSKVKSKFPGLGLDIILKLASDAAFSNQKKP